MREDGKKNKYCTLFMRIYKDHLILSLTPHVHPRPQTIRYMDHITHMFLKIYVCIQCETLTYTWHINIPSLSMVLSAWVLRSQTTFGSPQSPSLNLMGELIGMDRRIDHRETTQIRMTPHLYTILSMTNFLSELSTRIHTSII